MICDRIASSGARKQNISPLLIFTPPVEIPQSGHQKTQRTLYTVRLPTALFPTKVVVAAFACQMSRKAKEIQLAKSLDAYAAPGCLVASLGYAPLKPTKLPKAVAVVLWTPEADIVPHAGTQAERLGPVLPALQHLLMSADAPAPPPVAIFIVDCSPLLAGGNPRSIIDAEGATDGPLGKNLGKPIGRFLEKLLAGYRGNLSLVAFDGGAQLALRLLQAAPRDHGIKEGLVKRLVLLRPRLTAAAIYALLSKPAKVQTSVDVYYESATALEKRDVMVRHAYAEGTSHVLAAAPNDAQSIGDGLYVALLSDGNEAPADVPSEGALIDPDGLDLIGQSVFWAELAFEMNKDTKQSEAVMAELDAHEIEEAVTPTEVTEPAEPLDAIAAAPVQRGGEPVEGAQVGALILRGSRCVLARSLTKPPAWRGMRIPSVVPREGEAPHDAAVRLRQ